ncbi:MAG: hypothetical protein ACPG4T_01725 [Nannocystaceae bacterium]
MSIQAGQTVCGRFELLREEPEATGSQVFGRTWVVLDGDTGDVQRATFVDAELLPSEETREAFVTHASALIEVAEAGGGDDLVPVTFVGRHEGLCVVIYEALHGGIGLADAFADPSHPPDDRRLELARFVDCVPRALGFLHRHRLVQGLLSTATTFSWDSGHALWQYGLAPYLDRETLMARNGAHCDGAVAPEVADGGPWSAVADVYTWGAALAHYITGFDFDRAVRRAQKGQLPGVSSPELVALIGEAVANNPEDRPADGDALRARLDTLGFVDEDSTLPSEALVDALAGVGDHVFEPELKPGKSDPAPSASSSAMQLPVTNLEDLAEPSRPHAAASQAAMILQASAAISQTAGKRPVVDEDGPSASVSGARKILVLEKRVSPSPVSGADESAPDSSAGVGLPPPPDLANASRSTEGKASSSATEDGSGASGSGLTDQVAAAVGQGSASIELRDNVNAALASALFAVGDEDDDDDLGEPPEHLTASVDGSSVVRADPDAPMAVRRHRSRATYPLGHTAIPDTNDEVVPTREPEVDESVESEVGEDTNPEGASDKLVEPEKPAEKYTNIALAVIGGLVLAYVLLTWLKN